MASTRARKGSINVITNYVAGKLFDITGLSDGDGFAYDLASDSFLPVPFPTGDLVAANNLSDVANAATALSNLGGEPAIGAKGTAFNKNFGTTAGTVAEGNHNHSGIYLELETDPVWTSEKVNYYTKTEVGNLPVSTFSNDAGYLTSFVESDPVFTAWDKSTGISIVHIQISDWATATGSFLTSFTETDPVFIASQAANITATDITNLANLSGINSGNQVGDGVTITGDGSVGNPFVAVSSGGGTWGSITGTLADQTDLQTALDAKVGDTGNETIAGIKTFSSFPISPSSAPITDYELANKKYVDDVTENVEGGNASSTYLSSQIIDGGAA